MTQPALHDEPTCVVVAQIVALAEVVQQAASCRYISLAIPQAEPAGECNLMMTRPSAQPEPDCTSAAAKG